MKTKIFQSLLLVGVLILSSSFEKSKKQVEMRTCTGVITSVTAPGGCVSGGQSTQICVTWTGNIEALKLTNKVGFTGGTAADVSGGSHCFNITVDNGRTDVIYFDVEGAGGECIHVYFGSYCIDNCSGASCS